MRRILITILLIIVGFNLLCYGVAYWYQKKYQHEPLEYGTTFVPSYAEHFGLDPRQTLQAMIDDLGVRNFRFVSYWKEIEPTRGTYDFSRLDWQFKMAEESGSKVSLAIGVRQPRWPECHEPAWALNRPIEEWYPDLQRFITVVVERYKSSPALESYQLENEYFLSVFGECTDFSRQRLIEEYELVKRLDAAHPVIISRSNNIVGLPVGEPRPDMFAVSVYKRVWDKVFTKRYLEYPFPPWFYSTLAGGGEIMTGRRMMIHELQAEPWIPETGEFAMNDVVSLPEQDKSMNAEMLKKRFEYARQTGIKRIDMWGAEWWYWRKEVAKDPSLWEVAKEEFQNAR